LLAPVAALTLICLVVSAALAVTNSATAPVIAAAARTRAEAAQKEVLPEADTFETVRNESLPESVTEAYAAANGAGYVFMLTARGGYGGDIGIIVGIDGAGVISAVKTLSHSETEGIGASAIPKLETGLAGSVSPEEVQAVSGATVTSKAFLGAIDDAFKAYGILKGA
jgi:electron transport complex protein RnfG